MKSDSKYHSVWWFRRNEDGRGAYRMNKQFTNLMDLIGKPFQYGGRGPDEYDCLGLCIEIYKRLGISLPDINTPDSASLRETTFLTGKDEMFECLEKPKPFCFVAFKIRPHIWHAGIVLEDCWHFIHIARKKMVVIERLDNVQWQHKFDKFYEYKG